MRETIKLLCVVALSLFGCATLLELHGLIRDVRQDERKMADDTETLIATAQRASDAAYAAETKQLDTLERTSKEFYKLTAAARLVLVRSDRSLNDTLVPRLAAAVDGMGADVHSAAADLSRTTDNLAPGIAALVRASNAAADDLGDPSIRASLESVAQASSSLADSAKQLNGIATDAKNLADYEVKQLETPEKVWLSVLKFVLGYGADARGLFLGYR